MQRLDNTLSTVLYVSVCTQVCAYVRYVLMVFCCVSDVNLDTCAFGWKRWFQSLRLKWYLQNLSFARKSCVHTKCFCSTSQITSFISSTFPLIINQFEEDIGGGGTTKKVWDFLAVRTEEQTAWGGCWGHVRSTTSEVFHHRLIKHAGTI